MMALCRLGRSGGEITGLKRRRVITYSSDIRTDAVYSLSVKLDADRRQHHMHVGRNERVMGEDMRQVILDTETTGLECEEGHRVIEIACLELIDGRSTGVTYHQYINPGRAIDAGAVEVHGISESFLQDKPEFQDIASELLALIDGAELIIHNAPFDIGFLNNELRLTMPSEKPIDERCRVIDTLALAKQKHPGIRNSLGALAERYGIVVPDYELGGTLQYVLTLTEVYMKLID
jgi:DNA polymerase III subunit epsilon